MITIFSQQQVNEIKAKFRILKDWNIVSHEDGKYYDECTVLPEKKKAFIKPWHDDNPPIDYLLHEILHCAIRQLLEIKEKTRAYDLKLHKAEEELIQDICHITHKEIM